MSSGHIRPRGPGSWELKYDIGRDPITGRRRVRYKTVRGAKRDAQRELRELLGAVDRGMVADAGKTTTGQWLEQWLAECKHTVAPKTWQERAAYVRLHLAPALGTIPLARLAAVQIQAYYSKALSSGRLDGKGGLAPQTVRHHDRTLHTALERARKLRLIATNPVNDVEPPRVERARMITLRPDEQAAILAAAQGTALYVPVLLALATGLRRGELLGLAWTNTDLDAGLAHVVQVVEETKAGVRIKPQPKTTNGRRTVTLPQAAIEALRQHKAAQAEECLRLGLAKPDLLFPRWARSPAVFSTAFTRMASRIGIKAGVHALRHTHITDLLAAGMHPKVVSERAGHSSVAFTLQRYAHVLPGMQEAAARQVDVALRRALGWQTGGISGSGDS
jgi:integrase